MESEINKKIENWEKSTNKQIRYWNSLKGIKNEKAPNWRGDKAKKEAIHNWLEVNYGKTNKCENPFCEKRSNIFEWCKKPNYKHERKRENYTRLCRSCHRKLDKIFPPNQIGKHWKWHKKELKNSWEKKFVEKGADLEHKRWVGWQSYLFSKSEWTKNGYLIPKELCFKWQRQIDTSYSELSEEEKENDRKEVRKYLPQIRQLLKDEK